MTIELKDFMTNLVLIGNLDTFNLLMWETKQEIEYVVKKSIKDEFPGGYFILLLSHSHSKINPTRLK